jgi:hypothetical protein
MEKKMSLKKIALATSTFACMTLLGVSLSVGSAQARLSHVMAHHHHVRAAHGVAGAIDVAITSPWQGPAWASSYYGSSPWGDYDCKPPFAFECRPYATWGAH